MSTFVKIAEDITTVTASGVTTFEFGGGGVTGRPKGTGVCQIAIVGGTATLAIEGRMSADLPWVVLGSYTADDMVEIVICPDMRVDVTVISGATVNVWLVP